MGYWVQRDAENLPDAFITKAFDYQKGSIKIDGYELKDIDKSGLEVTLE